MAILTHIISDILWWTCRLCQSTLGQHSSPQYRSSLLGTDSSSPR